MQENYINNIYLAFNASKNERNACLIQGLLNIKLIPA